MHWWHGYWPKTPHPGFATAVRRDLLDQADDDPQVQVDRRAMLADPQVHGLLAELAGWPGKVVSSHKSAGQPFHKLTFAADLGLRVRTIRSLTPSSNASSRTSRSRARSACR